MDCCTIMTSRLASEGHIHHLPRTRPIPWLYTDPENGIPKYDAIIRNTLRPHDSSFLVAKVNVRANSRYLFPLPLLSFRAELGFEKELLRPEVRPDPNRFSPCALIIPLNPTEFQYFAGESE